MRIAFGVPFGGAESVAPVTTHIGRSAGPIDSTDPPEAHIQELKHAQTYLEGQGVKADYAPAIGHPAETIAQVAKDRGVDLVILGTKEHIEFRIEDFIHLFCSQLTCIQVLRAG